MNQQMTTFYIVRHGETDWNTKKLIQGITDNPLNAKGEIQAKELGEKLRHIKFDMAFSSDLLRAKRTAEIIALEHQLEVQTTNFLRERDYLSLEGQSSDIYRTYDKLMEKLSHEDRRRHRIVDGIENDEELVSRIFTFLRETAITHPGKTILMVTHGGILRALIIHLGIMSYKDTYQVKNTAYITLSSDGIEFFVKETEGIEKVSN